MNGVCVRWRGWIDLERLDGVGCLEYDEEQAVVSFLPTIPYECISDFYTRTIYIFIIIFFTILQIEDSMLRDQIERYNQRLRDFEERQKAYRAQQDRIPDQDLEVFNSIKNFFQF